MKRILPALLLAALAVGSGAPAHAAPTGSALAGCDGALVATSQITPPGTPTVTGTLTISYFVDYAAAAVRGTSVEVSAQFRIDCWLQSQPNAYDGSEIPGTHTFCQGNTAVGSCANPYTYAYAFPRVFLCSHVAYSDPTGEYDYVKDADPATDGVQCVERLVPSVNVIHP